VSPAWAVGPIPCRSVSVPAMELDEILRHRHMVRHYTAAPVPADVLERVLRAALRGPSAGFSQGLDLLVLQGHEETGRLFEQTSDPGFWSDPGPLAGLLAAPVIVLPLADPGAYQSRYGEPDKRRSGLAGIAPEDWPVPYWLVDASFAVMLFLLAATSEGLGALFFRLHRDPAPFLSARGVPDGRQVIGALALGYEDPSGRGGSLVADGSTGRRPRRPTSEAVHNSRW